MIAQIQGLQYFVANHLSDVVDWQKHVRTDDERYPRGGDGKVQYSGDQAHILITTPFNRYRMSIISAYLEPPPGAPIACKSLGTVTFHDLADGKRIVGPKADLTWTDISKHIHVRELTDALAAARRELAEGTGSAAKLAEVAERAKKWGITVRVPQNEGELAIVPPAPPPHVMSATTPPSSDAPIHSVGPAPDAPTSRDAPWLGAPIMFITNPGEQIGGMQEIVGWCVRVYSHDRISIFMTPDHSEPSYRDNLPRRGSPAGNGNVHRFNCWDFNPEVALQKKEIEEMFHSITRLIDRIEILELNFKSFAQAETKRRGRPPKTATEPGAELADEMDRPSEKPEGSEAA